MDIFNILKQDVDDVIMIINHFIEVGANKEAEAVTQAAPTPAKRGKKIDNFWNYV